jgi:serine/threonine protein phosphatase PrpC
MTGDFRRLAFAQKTDRGLVREINEDACGYRIPEPNTPSAAYGTMFVVADGIGGMGRGEEASRVAVEALLNTYYDPELDDESPRERIIAAIQDANEAVRAHARTLKLNMLGTTLAGAVILPSGSAFLFNVGDSRIYLLNGHHIEQVTSDHSLIDAHDNLSKAKLTAFIGQFQPVLPQIHVRELQPDDTLMICSDGLWGLVDPPEIAAVLLRYPPRNAVDKLVRMVHERGARDNVTITIIQRGKALNFVRTALALTLIAAALLLFVLLQPVLIPGDERMADNVQPTEIVMTNSPEIATPETVNNHGQLVIRTPTQQIKSDK